MDYVLNGSIVGRGETLEITGTGITSTPLNDGIHLTFPAGGGSGITQLTGGVTAGPGSGSVAATVAAVNLETATITNIAINEIVIGDGAGSAVYVAVTGDGTIASNGTLLVTGVNGHPVDTQGIQNTAQTYFGTFMPLGAPEAQSGPGAIVTTSYQTKFTSTGTGDALTLADGTIHGQLKKILYVAEGGGADTGVLTAATGLFTSITFNAIGDYVSLMWLDSLGWTVVETSGVTVV